MKAGRKSEKERAAGALYRFKSLKQREGATQKKRLGGCRNRQRAKYEVPQQLSCENGAIIIHQQKRSTAISWHSMGTRSSPFYFRINLREESARPSRPQPAMVGVGSRLPRESGSVGMSCWGPTFEFYG